MTPTKIVSIIIIIIVIIAVVTANTIEGHIPKHKRWRLWFYGLMSAIMGSMITNLILHI